MRKRQFNTFINIIKQASTDKTLVSFAERMFQHDEGKLFTELYMAMEAVIEDTSKEMNGQNSPGH